MIKTYHSRKKKLNLMHDYLIIMNHWLYFLRSAAILYVSCILYAHADPKTCQKLEHEKPVLGLLFDVHHCVREDDHHHGTFVIRAVNSSSADDTVEINEKIRLAGRIVGPIVEELFFKLNRKEESSAHYYLPAKGEYRVNIEVRYLKFDPESITHTRVYFADNEIITEHRLLVTTDVAKTTPQKVCDMDDFHARGYWTNSRPDSLPSKWIYKVPLNVTNEEKINPGEWEKYRDNPEDSQAKFIEGLEKVVEYVPSENCKFITLDEMQAFAVDSKFCLIGDSQMRHLGWALQSIATDDYSYMNQSRRGDKTKPTNANFLHFDDNYLQSTSDEALQAYENCTDVIVGVGQWFVGFPDASPMSDYVHRVSSALQVMKASPYVKNLLWIGTSPYGNNPFLYAEPPMDHRADSVLEALNHASMNIAKELGIDYINFFEIGTVLRDLAFDFCHFKTPVQTNLAFVTYTALHSRREAARKGN